MIDNIFGKKVRRNRSYLKSLIEMALSDGYIDESELHFLNMLARKLQVSEQELLEIKKNHKKVEFKAPKSNKRKFSHIYDLVFMMMIDGQINEREKELCKAYALKLGFIPRVVDDLVVSITEFVSGGLSIEKSYQLACQNLAIR